MSALIIVSALMAIGAPPENAKQELFAKEGFYKSTAGKEQSFTGVVRYKKGPEIGFGRYNPYRLEIKGKKGKPKVWEIYMGGKLNTLKPFVDKQVTLIGKTVFIRVEGQKHNEIWPGWIILQGKGAIKDGGKKNQVKILATAPWPFVRATPNGSRKGMQFVIRSEKELKKYTKGNNQRLKFLMKKLPGKTIDWDKQMLVVVTAGPRPTGGYRIHFTKITISGKKMNVGWQVIRPSGIVTQAFTHPALVGVVAKFDGPVEFSLSSGGGKFKRPPFKRPGKGKLPFGK